MATAANYAFGTAGTYNSAAPRRKHLPDPSRLIVGAPHHAWFDDVSTRLTELLQLPQGWDGYSAPPVAFENAYFAIDMLRSICPEDFPAPQIVPGTAGDLQVEWHFDHNGASIELHVKAPNSVTAFRECESAPDGEEIELTNDFLQVWNWIKEMPGVGSATSSAAA